MATAGHSGHLPRLITLQDETLQGLGDAAVALVLGDAVGEEANNCPKSSVPNQPRLLSMPSTCSCRVIQGNTAQYLPDITPCPHGISTCTNY